MLHIPCTGASIHHHHLSTDTNAFLVLGRWLGGGHVLHKPGNLSFNTEEPREARRTGRCASVIPVVDGKCRHESPGNQGPGSLSYSAESKGLSLKLRWKLRRTPKVSSNFQTHMTCACALSCRNDLKK